MVELTALPALKMQSVTHGTCSLSCVEMGQITQVMPYQGRHAAVEAELGRKLPKPNRVASKGKVSVQWFGRNTYLLIGAVPAPNLAKHAALSDQSDGWVALSLQGERAQDVLARLVPVDLRAPHFKTGHTVRSLIQHMNGSVTCTGKNAFTLMVMRSMGQTLWHDVDTAMKRVASRKAEDCYGARCFS